jgi:hypothetical protein
MINNDQLSKTVTLSVENHPSTQTNPRCTIGRTAMMHIQSKRNDWAEIRAPTVDADRGEIIIFAMVKSMIAFDSDNRVIAFDSDIVIAFESSPLTGKCLARPTEHCEVMCTNSLIFTSRVVLKRDTKTIQILKTDIF